MMHGYGDNMDVDSVEKEKVHRKNRRDQKLKHKKRPKFLFGKKNREKYDEND